MDSALHAPWCFETRGAFETSRETSRPGSPWGSARRELLDVLRTGLWRLKVWDGARIRPQAHVPESGLILPDFGAKEREHSPSGSTG